MRVLVVEDDVRIANLLVEAFTNRQYEVDTADNGESAWNLVNTLNYDLIVLDLTLPKIDGIKLCQQIRTRGATAPNAAIPVMMLTARDTIADKIVGLDAGADDYMVKPFDIEELMARIRALLRRGSPTANPTLTWDGLQLNPSTYEATYQGIPLLLTPKEFALLELLIASGRRVMSRPIIIERLWLPEETPTEEAVKTHIRTLRQKLKAAKAPDNLIETVYGMGYRLKQST
ncbi:response regulator transcription factor [Phormidium sp. FACHB-592]|uniref:Response regulator transcription factor n=1 Tax=Stenomitos frigidus AS-A4 TaxID=2933935 RepID=A0ABV0KSH3_9CYAN|nr:response regulator transcription factor [Phormidium sp. FACHB-592]MBD2075584.1 response regulator transcription factor [Phormidium sp. FACHB-592]